MFRKRTEKITVVTIILLAVAAVVGWFLIIGFTITALVKYVGGW